MRRLAALGLTTLATIAVAGAAVTGPARADTTGAGSGSCVMHYDVIAAYSGGSFSEIIVGFSGFPAEPGWEASFSFVSPQQQIVLLPGEQLSQSGESVVITNPSQATPSEGSLQVSFVATTGATNPPPVNFNFDGVACTTQVG